MLADPSTKAVLLGFGVASAVVLLGRTGPFAEAAPVLSDYGPASVVAAGLAGTAPSWGQAAPPPGASLSTAYTQAVTASPTGYQPTGSECSLAVHGYFWTWGPDGKVYPTWHPTQGPGGCTFGHEHGDDPRTSALIESVGWPPFGYTNEVYAATAAQARHEDHVGHKVGVLNGMNTFPGNDRSASPSQVCDTYLKIHQGTHSADATTNTLHELFYNARCRHLDDGSVSEARVKVLLGLGQPGSFNTVNSCDGSGLTVHAAVGPATPATAPNFGGERRMPDADCATAVSTGGQDVAWLTELWTFELHVGGAGGLQRLDLNPYAIVNNPSRYFDPNAPDKVGRTVDLCFRGASGEQCRAAAQQGRALSWNDPRSPFNGARRRLNPNYFRVVNTGPATMYSDALGQDWSTTSGPGRIQQYVSGSYQDPANNQGDIFVGGDIGDHEVDYGGGPQGHVHAPN